MFFIETLTDLHQRLDAGQSAYNVVKASGLLRLLLIDEHKLVDQVRKALKARRDQQTNIQFRIAIGGPYEQTVLAYKPVFWAVNDGFYPPQARVQNAVKSVGMDDFLRTRIMIFEGYEYSVRELIRELAHREGGVHAGVSKGSPYEIAKEEALKRVSQQISIGGRPAGISAVRAVGLVVCDALQPLKEKVEKELQAW